MQKQAAKDAKEQAQLDREFQERMLDKKLEAGTEADPAMMAKIAEERRQFDLAHAQTVKEYEEGQKERREEFQRSSGALEQAIAARRNSARPDSPSVLQQLEEERATHPQGMPVMDEEGNVAYGQ
jgi:hypothetical protein